MAEDVNLQVVVIDRRVGTITWMSWQGENQETEKYQEKQRK